MATNKRIFGILIVLGMALAAPFLWNKWMEWYYRRDIYTVDEARPEPIAIVFGAAVYRSGRLSPMLQDRVDTAIALYRAGKVSGLLFSGDGASPNYDEPGRMRDYALAQGVPAGAIQLDPFGRRTYETCYRARHTFQIQSAILVTQQFHLSRALFTCHQLDLQAIGVAADLRAYHPRSLTWSENREWFARLQALLDVTFD